MSSSANVLSIAALEELKAALMRFKSDARGSLETAEVEISRVRSWLQERLAYWQSELKRRRRQLQEAEAALAGCLMLAAASAGYADCSPLEAAVIRAKRRVEEAEQELRVVQQYIKMIEDTIFSYQRQARQLVQILDNDLLKGAQLLSNSVAILSSYASGGSGISSASSGHDTSSPVSSGEIGSGVKETGKAKFDSVYVNCPNCGGSGTEDVECNPCGGTGHRFDGEKCPYCRGLGKKTVDCLNCEGTGTVLKA